MLNFLEIMYKIHYHAFIVILPILKNHSVSYYMRRKSFIITKLSLDSYILISRCRALLITFIEGLKDNRKAEKVGKVKKELSSYIKKSLLNLTLNIY